MGSVKIASQVCMDGQVDNQGSKVHVYNTVSLSDLLGCRIDLANTVY